MTTKAPHKHAALMLAWALDQATGTDARWYYRTTGGIWRLINANSPCWVEDVEYRREPAMPYTSPTVIAPPEKTVPHSELRKTWSRDQQWEYRVTWGNWTPIPVGRNPLWLEECQYRMKLGARGSPYHMELQSRWSPGQTWQFRLIGNVEWESLWPDAEPTWGGKYEYRQKPVEFHREGREQWSYDQIRNPSQVWERLGLNFYWVDVSGEPEWLEHEKYRHKPVIY